jgi:hypothetical protein
MTRKPKVGDKVTYAGVFGDAEIRGTVVDLLSSQFVMETDDGLRIIVTFREPWTHTR